MKYSWAGGSWTIGSFHLMTVWRKFNLFTPPDQPIDSSRVECILQIHIAHCSLSACLAYYLFLFFYRRQCQGGICSCCNHQSLAEWSDESTPPINCYNHKWLIKPTRRARKWGICLVVRIANIYTYFAQTLTHAWLNDWASEDTEEL